MHHDANDSGGSMRALNRILFALLIVGLLGAMMPVAAETVSPNNYQSSVDWRFVSPKPKPGYCDQVPAGMTPGYRDTLPVDQPAPLAWLIVSWLFGVGF
jgi:hypothetical protein